VYNKKDLCVQIRFFCRLHRDALLEAEECYVVHGPWPTLSTNATALNQWGFGGAATVAEEVAGVVDRTNFSTFSTIISDALYCSKGLGRTQKEVLRPPAHHHTNHKFTFKSAN
jgi:hypothetical protein